MTDTFTTILIAVLGSSVVLEIVKALIGAIQKACGTKEDYAHIHDLNPIKAGLLAIMQDRLEHTMTTYLKVGQLTSSQAKALDTMINAYEQLGGDGFIHQLYDNVKKLEIIKGR